MKIERLPMQHTYDAGTWVLKDEDGLLLSVARDGIDYHIKLTEHINGRSLFLSVDEARAVVQMLTDAIESVKDEE